MSLLPNATRPAAPKFGRRADNSYAERAVYLIVAAIWGYCIATAMEPFGQGGIHSRRDLNKFLWVALSPSALLVLCAFTSRATTVGYIARWLAIMGIVVAAGVVWPLLAFFFLWLLGSLVGIGDRGGPFLFFGGALALVVAAVLLLKAVLTPQRPTLES